MKRELPVGCVSILSGALKVASSSSTSFFSSSFFCISSLLLLDTNIGSVSGMRKENTSLNPCRAQTTEANAVVAFKDSWESHDYRFG